MAAADGVGVLTELAGVQCVHAAAVDGQLAGLQGVGLLAADVHAGAGGGAPHHAGVALRTGRLRAVRPRAAAGATLRPPRPAPLPPLARLLLVTISPALAAALGPEQLHVRSRVAVKVPEPRADRP